MAKNNYWDWRIVPLNDRTLLEVMRLLSGPGESGSNPVTFQPPLHGMKSSNAFTISEKVATIFKKTTDESLQFDLYFKRSPSKDFERWEKNGHETKPKKATKSETSSCGLVDKRALIYSSS
jgi:hypothetical protein